MSKRKLTAADGANVRAARLRKDLSALFELPCVPLTVPPAPQPAAFRGDMFAYQRRSLTRMIEIESGTALTVEIGVHQKVFTPKGGVVADTVGMGKTAQLIGLLLARPPAEQPGLLGALVVSPEHLCHQWRSEIARFAGDALDVALVTDAAEMQTLASRVAWWARRGGGASGVRAGGADGVSRVLVVSLEYVCAHEEDFFVALHLASAMRFDRLILDECHDAVLLNGCTSMRTLLTLRDRSRKVWCVTGTPFPQGDNSVFGLHQVISPPRAATNPGLCLILACVAHRAFEPILATVDSC